METQKRFVLALAAVALAVAGAAQASDEIIDPYAENSYSTYCYYTCYQVVDSGSQKCRDGSGLEYALPSGSAIPAVYPSHSDQPADMYHTQLGNSLRFDLPQATDLGAIHYWNFNEYHAPHGFGPQHGVYKARIFTSLDTTNGTWTLLGQYTFDKARGEVPYRGVTLDLGRRVRALFVKITFDSCYSADDVGAGLAEIRFIGTPLGAAAVGPEPFAGGLSLRVQAADAARHRLRLSYTLPRGEHAALDILDVAGRHVARLLDGDMSAGAHELMWDEQGDAVGAVGGGVYFARLATADGRTVRKFVIAH